MKVRAVSVLRLARTGLGISPLPPQRTVRLRAIVESKVDKLGTRLESFPHKRLQGHPECKPLVGDYRVLYEFGVKLGRTYLHYVGNRREIYKWS